MRNYKKEMYNIQDWNLINSLHYAYQNDMNNFTLYRDRWWKKYQTDNRYSLRKSKTMLHHNDLSKSELFDTLNENEYLGQIIPVKSWKKDIMLMCQYPNFIAYKLTFRQQKMAKMFWDYKADKWYRYSMDIWRERKIKYENDDDDDDEITVEEIRVKGVIYYMDSSKGVWNPDEGILIGKAKRIRLGGGKEDEYEIEFNGD